MKNKFYKILFSVCFLLSFVITSNVKAQTTIYYETFDSLVMMLPPGWSADANGWAMDSVSANADTITGSSGHQNVKIANATGFSGTFNLYSRSISTSGYENISILWDARLTKHFADSGSTIQSFDYSINGGSTWTNVPYTENAANSGWYFENGGVRINLPDDANNQPSLEFKWVAVLVGNPSGTYRIDDFSVEGSLMANGIEEYNDQNVFKTFVDANKLLHLSASPSFKMPDDSYVVITDVTGRICLNEKITSDNNTFSLSNFKTGVYLIKIIAGDLTIVQKIVCN